MTLGFLGVGEVSFFIRRYLFAAAVVLGFGVVQPASAANILVFGDGYGTSAANSLEATLRALGHSVVNHGGVAVPGVRISILTDVNWLLNSGDIDVVENLQTYLQGGPEVVAMPEPGTTMLLVTAGFLGVVCRRRQRG